jgi:predicted permease
MVAPMHVIDTLLPVFLIIALGKALTRTSFFTPDLGRNINRLTYWVALPAFLLHKITNATFSAGDVNRISLLLIATTLASALVATLIAKLLRLKHKQAGAFIQGSSRANNAFVGLPVILYSMSGIDPQIETLATLALAPAIIFYNIFSVTVLLAYDKRHSRSATATAKLFTKQLLSNPLLISCAIALTLNLIGFHFPSAIQRSLSTLSGAALALALLSIGASLSFKGLNKGLPLTLLCSSIKVFIQPLIGFGLALLIGLAPADRQILLIYLACPTAVATYIMADIFDSDSELAAHIIVVSTLLSILSLSIIIATGG